MEGKGNQQEPNASSAVVHKLPGEPAVLINGVPDITPDSSSGSSTTPPPNAVETRRREPSVWGEMFKGREVKKCFMGRFYSGTVTDYDKDNDWYRVLYEDGDSEDLDWGELEQVLLPLDAKIPLKTVAKRVVKKTIYIKPRPGIIFGALSVIPKIKKKATKGKQNILP